MVIGMGRREEEVGTGREWLPEEVKKKGRPDGCSTQRPLTEITARGARDKEICGGEEKKTYFEVVGT